MKTPADRNADGLIPEIIEALAALQRAMLHRDAGNPLEAAREFQEFHKQISRVSRIAMVMARADYPNGDV